MFFANDLIQSYGSLIILVLLLILGALSYQMYKQRHQIRAGKKLTANVLDVLKKNNCKIKGDRVTCQGPQFAGLGKKFGVFDAVDKVVDMISAEMGDGPPPPPSQIPRNPYPPQRAGPATQAPPYQPPPTARDQQPSGLPEPIQTNPKRASSVGGGAPMSAPGPAPGASGGAFGGLMSADGEPLGGSLAGSDAPGGHSVGGQAYNADMF